MSREKRIGRRAKGDLRSVFGEKLQRSPGNGRAAVNVDLRKIFALVYDNLVDDPAVVY
jgi:hypothetical protein